MLDIGACMELQAKSGELTESADSKFEDTISFEELLAQEKKDSFWSVPFCWVLWFWLSLACIVSNPDVPYMQAEERET